MEMKRRWDGEREFERWTNTKRGKQVIARGDVHAAWYAAINAYAECDDSGVYYGDDPISPLADSILKHGLP